MKDIKTWFLIISDTHANQKIRLSTLQEAVDVAIHCGDLTDGSKIAEYHTTLNLLQTTNAPLKLVIAGNHDFTLDTPMHQKKAAEAHRLFSIDPALMNKEYGDFGDARKLFDTVNTSTHRGIIFLDEGIHRFDLANGASLTVYASPFTPSIEADWGFQYRRSESHDFNIIPTVDIVITHGPPKGVLDVTASKRRGGCEQLFAAVAKAKPRLHCFGHIHEGWGAKAVAWRVDVGESPTHFSAIDNGASAVVESLATLRPGRWDTPDTIAEKDARLRSLNKKGYRHTSHCTGDEHPIIPGQSTLFANAAIEPESEGEGQQLPWIIDLELPALVRATAA
ncbi:Metallo-dependent phosphatase-like protein [Schizothecium vesticola]|uniref:Metallo-dependent phosphatase-like protein n=1 Tax=Schizothecium vesticola TaxID=314040 RepID=A0AA40JZN6_9PEZI|nr:Metallo-dependent phosphatase-like protein [Schizothecium vesticola]